jgi:hypothetical protein
MGKLNRVKGLFALAGVAAVILSNPSELRAAGCGFAGMTGAGTLAGGTGFVLLFSPVSPFPATALGSIGLGTATGDACMDIWRDSTLGPAPPNFNAVYSPAPPACAAAACTTPAICLGVTVCTVLP